MSLSEFSQIIPICENIIVSLNNKIYRILRRKCKKNKKTETGIPDKSWFPPSKAIILSEKRFVNASYANEFCIKKSQSLTNLRGRNSLIYIMGQKNGQEETKDAKTGRKHPKEERWTLGRKILCVGVKNKKKDSAFRICKKLWRGKRKAVGCQTVPRKDEEIKSKWDGNQLR